MGRSASQDFAHPKDESLGMRMLRRDGCAEARLRWFRHVQSRDTNAPVRRCERLAMDGSGGEGLSETAALPTKVDVRSAYTLSSPDPTISLDTLSACHTTQAFPRQTSTFRCCLAATLQDKSIPSALPAFGKTKNKNPYDERRLLEQNKRIQRENNAPEEFPSFIREGFEVKVVMSDNYVKRDSGLIVWDFAVGEGDCPNDGQQVIFHYIGYNESGRRIDSTYLQGKPAKIRMGSKALVPGFEEGIRDMRPGGKRRIIIPPELGPPVGPSTFFSSKQFEVFDVELLDVQDCQRRTIGFYSDV
ncbi:hypothetical protein RND71_035045 [Anisodus tanguticus]|uniref:peptidylprolyl isomerase n=1 Tax=Anisodus tanguticus TaxID=243964 RepID=A0AAE1R4Y7_9SOLA|nr:hypothetical protein RND71_035045 [Anisodus tanguticus]